MSHAAPHADDVRTEPVSVEPDERGPRRRCIATGVVADKDALVRFVVAPSGELVPDLQQRLPGRGLYVAAERSALDVALKKRAFTRAAKRPVTVPVDLADRLEALIAGHTLELISLARRAGQAVVGHDQVVAWLKNGRAALLLQARDGATAGRARLAALAGDRPVVELLSAAELAQPFGRDHVVHVALAAGGIATRAQAELGRLAGLRRVDQEAKTA
ncbi:MAG: RNA-binding protein [Proteobacteria bacterium]|nr:RNA-binding protein [Pseudomonadota bacterium]